MPNIVFCLTGNHFTSRFLQSWTKLISHLPEYRVSPTYSYTVGSEVFKLRNTALGGDRQGPVNQPPFRGLLYDYLFWLDSDMVFEPTDFYSLLSTLESSPNISILAALYTAQPQLAHYSAALHLTRRPLPHSAKGGYLTKKSLEGHTKPIPVDFSGMGFMLIRRGVVEALDYPWFVQMRSDQPGVLDTSGEDVSFCLRARDAGFPTYIHPQVVVGHEKLVVI